LSYLTDTLVFTLIKSDPIAAPIAPDKPVPNVNLPTEPKENTRSSDPTKQGVSSKTESRLQNKIDIKGFTLGMTRKEAEHRGSEDLQSLDFSASIDLRNGRWRKNGTHPVKATGMVGCGED
jgi:hypothetical protein